jgi:uncharacterized membrane protein YccF (DUF307 family)
LLAFGYFLGGVSLCITIIGVPFSVQAFKFSALAVAAFCRMIVTVPQAQHVVPIARAR